MIGALKGTLSGIDGNIGLIETAGGVVYETYVTAGFLTHNRIGSSVILRTYLQVRDDALVLFGFETKEEHRMFKLLLSVSGVGPKTAFMIVSHTSTTDLIEAVSKSDISYFTKIPGLGKKTGMKIILELSQKIKSEVRLEKFNLNEEDTTVIQALVALGYPSSDAHKIFDKIPQDLSVEDKIKFALRETTKKHG